MKRITLIGIGAVIGILVFSAILLSFIIVEYGEHHDNEHSHDSDMRLYGPGLGPHSLKISLMQFDEMEDIARDPRDVPEPINRDYSENVKISLSTNEVVSEIAENITYLYWTFNETVPGPFLRVRQGDTVEINLFNDYTSSHNHSIDLHAVTGPGGGATLTQVAPGENKSISFKVLNPGLYVYHCATPNVPAHVANGMYGMILVEPEEGMSEVDKEFYVMQGELYTQGHIGEEGHQWFSAEKMLAENPEYITFNGRVNGLVDNSLNAEVGDSIRLFVGNGGISKVSSFHVIGEIFDKVYHEGSTSQPNENVQTTLVPAGGSTITEFEVDVPGEYVLVDHALSRLDRGAWGIMNVEGDLNKEIYSEVKDD